MSWPQFYLACFAFGFFLSLISLVSGHVHFPVHLRVPGIHLPGAIHPAPAAHTATESQSSPAINLFTFMVFLTWFGGAGYLLTTYSGWVSGAVLATAVAIGVAGALVVFGFIAKVLLGHERPLEAIDFEMAGVLGKLTVGIRAGGTGELVYSQEGTRRVCSARSADGEPIARGTEVIVTSFEKGIAYVEPWRGLQS